MLLDGKTLQELKRVNIKEVIQMSLWILVKLRLIRNSQYKKE